MEVYWFITYMQLGGAYMPIIRKSPEKILEQIYIEEHESKRGKLKIFFGYAAGVGKTYAMLEAAHEVKKQGIDVVAGYIMQDQQLQL